MNAARIATWNLERPKVLNSRKSSLQLAKLREVNADLWILTETNRSIALSGYNVLAADPEPNYHSAGQNHATIMTRWPIMRSIPTRDPYFTICAEVASPFGPLIVFGTILTYANDRGASGESARWVEHRMAIERQSADWLRLRTEFRNSAFCIAGDFNQSPYHSPQYKDATSISALRIALDRSLMTCVTGMDLREQGTLHNRHTVDHVCLSKPLCDQVQSVGAWEGISEDGVRLSDHNGIFVDLRG